jgi:hypothetical protein
MTETDDKITKQEFEFYKHQAQRVINDLSRAIEDLEKRVEALERAQSQSRT